MFQKLLDVLFLRAQDDSLSPFEGTDSRKHWIPGDARAGPLISLPEELIKRSYLPSRIERCSRTISMYFFPDKNKKQTDLPWQTVRELKSGRERGVRKRVFKGRRLPMLDRRSTEMKMVRFWCDEAFKVNILKAELKCPLDAYNVFLKHISTYRFAHGEWRYDGYPALKTRTIPLAPPSGREEANEAHRHGQVLERGLSSDGTEQAIEAETNHNTLGLLQEVASNPPAIDVSDMGASATHDANPTELPQPNEEDEMRLVELRKIFGMASNNRLFFLLCKIGDEERDCQIRCVARALLEKCKEGIIRVDIILREALEYAALQNSRSVLNRREFRVRQHRILMNVRILKKARECLKLRPYECMDWKEFTDNN